MIEIVDGHAGIRNQRLGIDAAGTGAQQECYNLGRLLRIQRLVARNDLLSIEIGVDVSGNAGGGRSLQQPRPHGIDADEAASLEEKARENNDYWSAFLGVGGHICDDPSDKEFPPAEGCSNLDFCESVFEGEWIDTREVLCR